MRPDELIRDTGFAGEVRYKEPMSKHTSLGIGGPAEAMVYPASIEELGLLLRAARDGGVPVFILAGGTNLLVLDGGIPGLVLNLGKLDWIELEKGAVGGPAQVHAGAGVRLPKLVGYCTDAGLSGLEFAAGIPGTVGGAVVMNAGTKEAEMKDVLSSVTLVDMTGIATKLSPEELKLEYRKSSIPDGSVVVEAAVALIPWDRAEIKERVEKNMRRRKNTQPARVRSAGSTFKNPPGYSAWKLIDMAGLRGRTVGAAQVSRMHTNFLVNLGGATARDYRKLMEIVTETVKEKLAVELEPEIRVVGVDGLEVKESRKGP